MSSPEIENIPLVKFGKSELWFPHLIPEEGRRPSSLYVGMGCGGRCCSADERTGAYGEVVWSWRRDAGVKLVERSASDGDNKPAHRGEHEVSRKAIAQGMSECLRCPVCSCAPFFALLAHETAGAARTRHSLRPLFQEAQTSLQNLGRNAPRERGRSSSPALCAIAHWGG